MSNDDKFLIDIIQAARLILEFTKNMDFRNFSEDVKIQSSVLYQIVIIGKAVNRLPSNFIKI